MLPFILLYYHTASTCLWSSIGVSGYTALTFFFVFLFSQWQISVGFTFQTTVTLVSSRNKLVNWCKTNKCHLRKFRYRVSITIPMCWNMPLKCSEKNSQTMLKNCLHLYVANNYFIGTPISLWFWLKLELFSILSVYSIIISFLHSYLYIWVIIWNWDWEMGGCLLSFLFLGH